MTEQRKSALTLLTGTKYDCIQSTHIERSKPSLSELNSLLKFSPSVLSTVPQSARFKGYSEAKNNINKLYRPHNLVKSRDKRRDPVPYNFHGHPLCLVQQVQEGPARTRADARIKTTRGRSRTSEDDSKDSSSHAPRQDLVKASLRTETQPVQLSVSRKWEEEFLSSVSRSTAWFVARKCAASSDRSRLTAIVKQAHGSESGVGDADTSPSINKLISLPAIPAKQDLPEDQPVTKPQISTEIDDYSTQSNQDFITELSRALEGLQSCVTNLNSGTVTFGKDSCFQKNLQDRFPRHPEEWSENTDLDKCLKTSKIYTRGHRRWTSMPTPFQIKGDWRAPLYEESPDTRPSTKGSTVGSLEDVLSGRTVKSCGNELLDMLEEWRVKWKLIAPFGELDTEQINKALFNPSEGVRMSALYSITKLAISACQRSHSKTKPQQRTSECFVKKLQHFTQSIEKKLKDTSLCMRVSSAVLLTVLGLWDSQIEDLLLKSLSGSPTAEQWLALQCLAVQAVCKPVVVDSLLAYANQYHDIQTHHRAMELLTRLSKESNLVYATVSQQLNCPGWQERLAACQLLPMLHGHVTKDVSGKLVLLMWKDLCPEVRNASAEALGKLGYGKMVHDELCERLTKEDERIRLDAMRKVAALNLMTAQLLPAFLTCFGDPHISVKIEAASVAAEMSLKNREIIDALLALTEDSSVKVKAHAIQCLGFLGSTDPDVIECLLWCMKFNRNESLRAEACSAICHLGLDTPQVIQQLKSLVSYDDSELVTRVARETLIQFGHKPQVFNSMESKIAKEIKTLGTIENILNAT